MEETPWLTAAPTTVFKRTAGSPKNCGSCGFWQECCKTGTHGGLLASLSCPHCTYAEPAGVPGLDRMTCTGSAGASMATRMTSDGLTLTPPAIDGLVKKLM